MFRKKTTEPPIKEKGSTGGGELGNLGKGGGSRLSRILVGGLGTEVKARGCRNSLFERVAGQTHVCRIKKRHVILVHRSLNSHRGDPRHTKSGRDLNGGRQKKARKRKRRTASLEPPKKKKKEEPRPERGGRKNH